MDGAARFLLENFYPAQLEKRNSYFIRISILPDIDVRAIRLEEFHSRDVSELRNGILAFRNR